LPRPARAGRGFILLLLTWRKAQSGHLCIEDADATKKKMAPQNAEASMNLRSLMPVGRDRNVARSDNSFMSLQREIDRLFDDFTRGFPAFSSGGTSEMLPSVDVTDNDKQIEITAELPGLEDKDVQVNFADNVLTIRGEKKAEKEEKDKTYRLVERSYGSFVRSLELPDGVNADAIKASIDKGVLKVTVPKPAPAQVKKIDVKTAA
jgi:HSP20 family protein